MTVNLEAIFFRWTHAREMLIICSRIPIKGPALVPAAQHRRFFLLSNPFNPFNRFNPFNSTSAA